MILILSQLDDLTAQFVAGKLRRRGADVLWFDNEQFPTQSTLSLGYAAAGGCGQRRVLCRGGEEFDLSGITAAWYRFHGPPSVSEAIEDDLTRRFVERQARVFLNDFWQTLDCLWVPGARATVLRAEQKARQLALATELGFEIPPTLITNSPEEFLAFYREHGGRIISKPVHNGGVRAENEEARPGPVRARAYTEVVTTRDVGYASSVRHCPVIFQAYVPKQFELRVTLIGEQVFACEIHSQQTHSTRHDWRRYDLCHTPHRPHDLPATIKRLCLRLAERLGICFGAIDMVLTPDGRYVFLEINPNGQYAWIERLTGLPMSEALCDLLMTHEH